MTVIDINLNVMKSITLCQKLTETTRFYDSANVNSYIIDIYNKSSAIIVVCIFCVISLGREVSLLRIQIIRGVWNCSGISAKSSVPATFDVHFIL